MEPDRIRMYVKSWIRARISVMRIRNLFYLFLAQYSNCVIHQQTNFYSTATVRYDEFQAVLRIRIRDPVHF